MKRILQLFKLIFAYMAYILTFMIRRNEIFIISEKPDEARDNGVYFFKYLMGTKHSVNTYYIIKKNSADLDNIIQYKNNIIWFDSFKHYYYYFLSTKMISSQSYPYPISRRLCLNFFPCRKKKTYWLQHGVTKDYSEGLEYRNSYGVSFVCCSSKKEREIFVEQFHYPKEVAKSTGFCRFDGLTDLSNKLRPQILVMPTFRKWLTPKKYNNPTVEEIENFKNSKYYKFYDKLLHSEELITLLEKNNGSLIFYLHYAFQPYAELFNCSNPRIIVAKKSKYDVQLLMKQSNILITDFSSVAFDFAYMYKPVIYAHFDYDEYRSKHYGEGYFSYSDDGFGPITTDEKCTIEYIKTLDRCGYLMEAKYKNRTKDFFDTQDFNNCERVYKVIFGNPAMPFSQMFDLCSNSRKKP